MIAPRPSPVSRRRPALVALAGLASAAAIAAAGWYLWPARPAPPSGAATAPSPEPPLTATYVGEPACTKCHESQTAEWRQSDHARAMALATDADGPRRLRQRHVHLRRRHLLVLPARRQVLRADRRPRRRAARLRGQVHVRLSPAPAVPRSSSPAGACSAWPSRGTRGRRPRADSAGSTCTPSEKITHDGSAALDRPEPELELHVRRLPLDQPAAQLRPRDQHLQDDVVRNQRVVRDLPRTRARRTWRGRRTGRSAA